MASLSERIFAVIVSNLQAIQLADGYETDAGSNVLRARRSVDNLPALVVWDDGETAEDTGARAGMDVKLAIVVAGYVLADKVDSGAAIGALKADVKRALLGAKSIEDADGKIGVLQYVGATTSPREDGGDTEQVQFNFIANYKEIRGNPYSNKEIRE